MTPFWVYWANWGESYWIPELMLLQWVCVFAAGLKLITNCNAEKTPAKTLNSQYGNFKYSNLLKFVLCFGGLHCLENFCIRYHEIYYKWMPKLKNKRIINTLFSRCWLVVLKLELWCFSTAVEAISNSFHNLSWEVLTYFFNGLTLIAFLTASKAQRYFS